WLALVVALFCLPLWSGLGGTDLRNDEAIYAYAVDSILESGDWLNPKSSPIGDNVFLEKPPLKFWLIALPMRIGLLPHNEFGFRFWDALFGSVALLYVFALGRRMAGPLCGVIALIVLCGFQPLLFEHGLRDTVMEAPLVLAYGGGLYHFLRWSESTDPRTGRRHALAVGLFFVLGFMTKFVAVLFLPMILAATSLCVPPSFAKARRDWRLWGGVAALASGLIVPWFAYQAVVHGGLLWEVMFANHVVQRFTGTLAPEHLQPWTFYALGLYAWTSEAGILWLAVTGALLMAMKTVRDRWTDGACALVWFALPLTLISCGTSKLAYYTYPFLPPLALAVGYALCWVLEISRGPVDRQIVQLHEWSAGLKMPRALRITFAALCAVSTAVAIVTLAYGGFGLQVGTVTLFRNQSILRPTVLALIFGFLGARGLAVAPAARIVLLLMLVPIPQYRASASRTVADGHHTLRSARDCVLAVRDHERRAGRPTPDLVAALPPNRFIHSFFFYMRAAGWDKVDPISDAALADALHGAGLQRPVMMPLGRYVDFVHARPGVPTLPWPPARLTPAGAMPEVDDWIRRSQALSAIDVDMLNVGILLPGPYAVCGQTQWGPMLQAPEAASGLWPLPDVFK
ncbi:MAG: glycosyltransferase family 39 protein, partial [Acidobacteria bacterium]|nr:glycosyltransferase family 39 protein [Acidobacteriota bacterium]